MSGTNLSFAQSPPPITLPARAEETIGGLEDWRIGGLEDWRSRGLEDWKIGRLEVLLKKEER